MRTERRRIDRRVAALLVFVCGCAEQTVTRTPLPSVAPATQPSAVLQLGGAAIQPMYQEMLAIDLPTITRLAMARNIDVQQAKARIEANRGKYESSVEAVFPVIAPALAYQHLEGVNQNASGTLVLTSFNNFLPTLTIQWIINPGRIYYDILASKRRVLASVQDEEATELNTLRAAAVQYYDIVLAQARVGLARKAAAEAEEALRLTSLQVRAQTGLPADEMCARAFFAGRRQELLLAVNNFYQASLALALTLHLDPSVTLVPAGEEIRQLTLVRENLSIHELLGLAVLYRPDLKSARTLLAASEADKGAVVWGALGPQLQAAYTYGGLATRVDHRTYSLSEQQRGSASAGFALGLSTFGNIKTANATLRSIALDVDRQLDQVQVQVVSAQQASLTNAALIPIAQEQVKASEEALRLAQSNLKEGQILLLDVLQVEDQLDTSRLHYADAVARYNQSQVNLLAALGLLEPSRIVPTPTTQPVP